MVQLPGIVKIISGGAVELKEPEVPDDDDDDEDV
jgi:hypothetical protein